MSNDRFKFRLWDNLNRRYVKDMQIDQQGDICYSNGSKYCNGEHNEDFTVEQCTGLTDKNGALIYEGDILQFQQALGEPYEKILVHWKSCRFIGISDNGCVPFNKSDVFFDLEECCKIFVVVSCGNIHDEAEK